MALVISFTIKPACGMWSVDKLTVRWILPVRTLKSIAVIEPTDWAPNQDLM